MFLIVLILVLCAGQLYNGQPVDLCPTNGRIIGGVEASKGFAPHMVALVSGERNRRVFCGGSIISLWHVLTAAHCIDNVVESGELIPSLRGVVGSNKWNSTRGTVTFSSYVNHPKWDRDLLKYDIGVLYLTEKLILNDRIAIIKLDFNWIDKGQKSYVTGWGVTGPKIDDCIVSLAPTPDKLQLLHVKTISSKDCIDGMAETDNPFVPEIDPAVEICTFHSVGHGMCNGDSGSALVLEEIGKQIGIVSWGLPCAVGAPDVFTRISGVKDFILMVLEG